MIQYNAGPWQPIKANRKQTIFFVSVCSFLFHDKITRLRFQNEWYMTYLIPCYSEKYFSIIFSWFDSYSLIFDMHNVIKIISRCCHSIITKISVNKLMIFQDMLMICKPAPLCIQPTLSTFTSSPTTWTKTRNFFQWYSAM